VILHHYGRSGPWLDQPWLPGKIKLMKVEVTSGKQTTGKQKSGSLIPFDTATLTLFSPDTPRFGTSANLT